MQPQVPDRANVSSHGDSLSLPVMATGHTHLDSHELWDPDPSAPV